MSESKNVFFTRFMSICTSRELSPTTVLTQCNLSTSLFARWKNGGIPTLKTIKTLANYFHVSPEYMIGVSDTEENVATFKVPIYGRIACGQPMGAYEDIIDYVEVERKLGNKDSIMALRAHGHSMEPVIFDGDDVIIVKKDEVENGKIAAILIDGEDATLKKIEKLPTGVALISINPEFNNFWYSKEDLESGRHSLIIVGQAVETRKRLVEYF